MSCGKELIVGKEQTFFFLQNFEYSHRKWASLLSRGFLGNHNSSEVSKMLQNRPGFMPITHNLWLVSAIIFLGFVWLCTTGDNQHTKSV
jgi:hypothetical protein